MIKNGKRISICLPINWLVSYFNILAISGEIFSIFPKELDLAETKIKWKFDEVWISFKLTPLKIFE